MNHDSTLGRPTGPRENQLNVEGMEAAPPAEGFGQLWAKDILIQLHQPPMPEEVMRYWRENLRDLWPEGSEVYAERSTIRPGEVVGLDLGFGPLTLATGMVVLESDAHSFTVMAPEGHAFAGTNTFFAVDSGEGVTMAGVSILMRASDPFYELGLMFGGHRVEEKFWAQHLRNLAAHYAQEPSVRLVRRRLDRSRQWNHAKNIRKNSLLRSIWRRIPKVGAS